jgi:sugar phosphate isomerase/epimerase
VSLPRRDFVQVTGAACLAAILPPQLLDAHADKLRRIGIQLYTVRQALDADFAGTLERLAPIGYKEVEFAWNRGKSPTDTRKLLQDTGLTAPAAHLAVTDFEAGWDATVAMAHTLGIQYLVLAWIDADQRATLDDYHRWAERFNRFGQKARAAGFRFGYHNHAEELTPIDGQRPYDILLGETDPAEVAFEMDLYWVLEGGGDPLAYFAKWPGRFPLVHAKGRAADGRMVDVGAGSVDWAAIFAKRKEAGIRHYFVEHDEPADAFVSASASYQYLRALRFRDT